MNNPFYPSDQQQSLQNPPPVPPFGRQPHVENPRLLGPQQFSDGVSFWQPDDYSSIPPGTDPSNFREKTAHGTTKHRRTRSGCYTCRSRRVKCDEKKPICDRCLKGGRECVFPDKVPAQKSSGRSKAAAAADSGSSSDEDIDAKGLETIPDTEGDEQNEPRVRDAPASSGKGRAAAIPRKQSVPSLARRKPSRLLSETSASSKEKSNSPSTETSSIISSSQPLSAQGQMTSPISSDISSSVTGKRWAHLPPDVRFYIEFHEEHITYHHYFLKSEANGFIHNEFIDVAIGYEPLLYAVTGFSAYHHTLRQPEGKISSFLGYYTRSVSKLRKSLQSEQQHTECVLLTILQLATFEEYLGDWVNLIGHQRAAHQLLLELFTPISIMKTELRRQIFLWYSRFDVVAGLLGGNGTILGREWYTTSEDFHNQLARENPDNLESQLLSLVATCRTIGVDMATLFAKLPKGAITMDEFLVQNQELDDGIRGVRESLERLSKPEFAVYDFPDRRERTFEDIVDPYQAGGLYGKPYFSLNFSWIDWNAVDLMHKYQTALTMQQPIPPELEHSAFEQCRILDAIEKWPESPPGSLLAAHASVGIASIFLPKDHRHTIWLRRKLAMMEQMGYIYPPTFRAKMAELWQIPEINHWWLPNDEGYPPIIHSIRSFIGERTSMARPGDSLSEDLQNMKAIFSRLNIEDASSQKSSPNSGNASDPQGMSPVVQGIAGQQSQPQPRPPHSDSGVETYPEPGEMRIHTGPFLTPSTATQQQQLTPSQELGHQLQMTSISNQQGSVSRGGNRMSGIWEPGAAWVP